MAVADAGFDHDWDPGPPGRKKGNKSFRCVRRYSISGWQKSILVFSENCPHCCTRSKFETFALTRYVETYVSGYL
jgi:hypothetical protein